MTLCGCHLPVTSFNPGVDYSTPVPAARGAAVPTTSQGSDPTWGAGGRSGRSARGSSRLKQKAASAAATEVAYGGQEDLLAVSGARMCQHVWWVCAALAMQCASARTACSGTPAQPAPACPHPLLFALLLQLAEHCCRIWRGAGA